MRVLCRGKRLGFALICLMAPALGGCASWMEMTDEEECRYVRRLGSRIPRLECNGQAPPFYGEMNAEAYRNATNPLSGG